MKKSTPDKDVLSLAEAARFLGITRVTLSTYIKAKAIPFRQVKRRYLFWRGALIEWLSGDYVKPADR